MTGKSVPVSVRIMDREFRVACPPEERDALIRAAQYLDDQMKQVRESGRLVGIDRIAVVTALNVTHELLAQRQKAVSATEIDAVNSHIKLLQGKIEVALLDGAQNNP
jgi:cell division protein ZapA